MGMDKNGHNDFKYVPGHPQSFVAEVDYVKEILEQSQEVLDDPEAPVMEKAIALIDQSFTYDVRLDKALVFLEEKFPPQKRRIIVMKALLDRLQYCAEEREKAYKSYAEKRDLTGTEKRVAFLNRMEEQIKLEYPNVKPTRIGNYVIEPDLDKIKEIGFIKFMLSPGIFLSTYENSESLTTSAII